MKRAYRFLLQQRFQSTQATATADAYAYAAAAATVASSDDFEDLQATIREYDKLKPRPQSLHNILKASNHLRDENKTFLREEFSIRCAERICVLEEKIPNFRDIPELNTVHTKHVLSFQDLMHHASNSTLENFTPVIRGIADREQDIIPLMCRGMARRLIVNQQTPDDQETFTNTFLDDFLLNRIGSNVLMSQYLSVVQKEPSNIIDPNCNVMAICRFTAKAVEDLCAKETGFKPTIHVETFDRCSSNMDNFAFIPKALSYILQELLKNSAFATANNQQRIQQEEDSDISIIVCADERHVMIHVADKAGGIPFDVQPHIWSYLYTTTKKRTDGEDSKTRLSGFGVGLPISRLYANYLGGSLNLVSLPGYGSHAYLFLPRLPEKLVETVPVRSEGWSVRPSSEFIL